MGCDETIVGDNNDRQDRTAWLSVQMPFVQPAHLRLLNRGQVPRSWLGARSDHRPHLFPSLLCPLTQTRHATVPRLCCVCLSSSCKQRPACRRSSPQESGPCRRLHGHAAAERRGMFYSTPTVQVGEGCCMVAAAVNCQFCQAPSAIWLQKSRFRDANRAVDIKDQMPGPSRGTELITGVTSHNKAKKRPRSPRPALFKLANIRARRA